MRLLLKMIISLNFDDIWNYLWIQSENNVSKNNKEYSESKSKFNSLNENNFIKNYILSIKGVFNEQEWGFPKGRRKIRKMILTVLFVNSMKKLELMILTSVL